GPIIEVRVTGEKVSQSRLEKLIPVYQERTVDASLLVEGQRNVRDYMRSRGFYDALVQYSRMDEPGRTIIEYQIERGEKHTLRAITFMGNEYFDKDTLRERMSIQPASWLRYRSGRYSPAMLEQDVASLRALYQSNGF